MIRVDVLVEVDVLVYVGVEVRVCVAVSVGVSLANHFKGCKSGMDPGLDKFQFNVIGAGPGKRTFQAKIARASTNKETTATRPLRPSPVNFGHFFTSTELRAASACRVYRCA